VVLREIVADVERRMHPEVVSDKPGRCPKCNMFLGKRKAN
jgi:hypothetical protein